MPTSPSAAASAPRAHPIHGILAAYPLTFFTGALFTDIVYANSADMMWANFSAWLITGGLVMGVAAAIAGIADAVVHRRRRAGRTSWVHSATTVLMMIVALANIFVHSRDAWTSVVPTGLILSVVVSVLALVSSWFGYSLQARQEAA